VGVQQPIRLVGIKAGRRASGMRLPVYIFDTWSEVYGMLGTRAWRYLRSLEHCVVNTLPIQIHENTTEVSNQSTGILLDYYLVNRCRTCQENESAYRLKIREAEGSLV
jgi:hypothetical protein